MIRKIRLIFQLYLIYYSNSIYAEFCLDSLRLQKLNEIFNDAMLTKLGLYNDKYYSNVHILSYNI
jgi:hypothetical protein